MQACREEIQDSKSVKKSTFRRKEDEVKTEIKTLKKLQNEGKTVFEIGAWIGSLFGPRITILLQASFWAPV